MTSSEKPQPAPLTREAILAAEDILSETVTVPEWGGTVIVRGLTGDERDDFEASCIRGKGRKTEVNYRNARAKLVVRCCYKPDGSRLFNDDDAAAVGKKGAAAVSRVYEVGARLSGLTEEDLEELAKN
jgi:hypothetical protein